MISNQNIPWRRLSVEAAAIVSSILLAFAIDAWWDERKDRIDEKEVLESLLVEFQTNKDEVASVILAHETAVHSVATLMELGQDEILALSTDEVQQHIQMLANPRTFDAVRGSIDALTSSGSLGILRDHELREALTTFVNILEDAVEDREYLSQTAMTVWNDIAESGGPWRMKVGNLTAEDCSRQNPHRHCYINRFLVFLPVATPQDLVRLRNNVVLMSHAKQNKINAVRYAAEIRQAELQIETVIRLLEKNLSRGV